MATQIFPLEVWTSQITQASIPANENALRVQVLEQPALGIESTQPASPAEDDLYVLGPSPTGAQWSDFEEGDVVVYKGGTWLAFAPFQGWLKTISGAIYTYSGTSWEGLTVPAIPTPPPVVSVTASLSLNKSAHAGNFLEATSSDPIVLTVPTDADQAWDGNTEVHVRQGGEGSVSFEAADGVTLQNPASQSLAIAEQFGVATLKRVAADTWALFGLLGEAV